MKKENSIKPSRKLLPSSKNTRTDAFPVEAKRLIRRVQNYSAAQNLFTYGDSFVLGISGGPDSVCLLDILASLRKKYDFRITLAHVNYGLRGRSSDLDEAFMKELACRYDLPLFILRPTITAKNNLEERLRDIRYRFFETIRIETKSRSILTAHHEDDQAETFLLHLFRGAGLRGLSAMRPKNGTLLRPLLNTSRVDILEYLHSRCLSFRTDASNATNVFLRNKIRNKLLPLLEKEYAPGLRGNLAKTAALVAEDMAHLDMLSEKLFDNILLSPHSFSLRLFSALTLSEQRRFLITFFQKHAEKPQGTWVTETQKMLSLAKNKNQILTFPGLKILRKGDTVLLIR